MGTLGKEYIEGNQESGFRHVQFTRTIRPSGYSQYHIVFNSLRSASSLGLLWVFSLFKMHISIW